MTTVQDTPVAIPVQEVRNPLEPALQRAFDLSDDLAAKVADVLRKSTFVMTCPSLYSADLNEDSDERAAAVRQIFGFVDNDKIVQLLVGALRSSVQHISCMKTPNDKHLTFYSEP